MPLIPSSMIGWQFHTLNKGKNKGMHIYILLKVFPNEIYPESLNFELWLRSVALPWKHPHPRHTVSPSGAEGYFPGFNMSLIWQVVSNVERAKCVVLDKGVDRPVGVDDHFSKVTTTTKHESSASEFDVSWSVPEDEDTGNPWNWSNSQKWTIIASLSLVTFLTYDTP